MNTSQVNKQELIEWIRNLDDEEILEHIKILKESIEDTSDWWNEISDAEKAGIKRGLEDVKAGRVTPHEEARKIYKKWL